MLPVTSHQGVIIMYYSFLHVRSCAKVGPKQLPRSGTSILGFPQRFNRVFPRYSDIAPTIITSLFFEQCSSLAFSSSSYYHGFSLFSHPAMAWLCQWMAQCHLVLGI